MPLELREVEELVGDSLQLLRANLCGGGGEGGGAGEGSGGEETVERPGGDLGGYGRHFFRDFGIFLSLFVQIVSSSSFLGFFI